MQGRHEQTRRRPRRKGLATTVAAALGGLGLLLAGCAPAGSAQAATVPTLAPVPAAVALLPQQLRDAGTLRVAIPTNEPPTQFFVPGTQQMTGVNPDVARLIGQALGLTVEIDVTNFDSIIPGLAAGRYDLTVSSMTPTEDRLQQSGFRRLRAARATPWRCRPATRTASASTACAAGGSASSRAPTSWP